MLEQRGHVPPGHGERAARYAGILAARLNLLPEDRRELELAARLHDVGKAGVRTSALGQRGVLTDDERASMREHPVRGARFLASVPSLARVAEAIRHHHEKYDGSGHPDGLRGDRIPLGARILAIADAYDLATSISPDGEPVPWPEALDRLREDRGTHFDPWLLDLFEAEIRSNPVPSRPLRPVMISTAGVMPYQATDDALRAFGVDGDLGETATLLDEEIEVLLDDGGVEPS
jgi:HD-GYP domain-containing protein (c-di-GMP phosphodiesterase class II)